MAYRYKTYWFKKKERVYKEIVKWIDADKVDIYEETITKCPEKK